MMMMVTTTTTTNLPFSIRNISYDEIFRKQRGRERERGRVTERLKSHPPPHIDRLLFSNS
jgi:hypothetical protein